jgi:hypothetical protein
MFGTRLLHKKTRKNQRTIRTGALKVERIAKLQFQIIKQEAALELIQDKILSEPMVILIEWELLVDRPSVAVTMTLEVKETMISHGFHQNKKTKKRRLKRSLSFFTVKVVSDQTLIWLIKLNKTCFVRIRR